MTNNGEVQTVVYSSGNTYLVDMAGIWEQFFPNLSFGMFKKSFFETKLKIDGKEVPFAAPRIKVEIRYAKQFQEVTNKLDSIVSSIVDAFAMFRNAEMKQFSLQKFESALNEAIGERLLAHEKMPLLLDIFTETVNESAMFTRTRSQFRVLRKRKAAGTDDTVYFVSSTAYARLGSVINQMLFQCEPNTSDNTFIRFYPLIPNKPLSIMPLLRLLELLDLASYEIRGGEKAEVFIRINDPRKIQNLVNDNRYRNNVLASIQKHHKRNIDLLTAFFTKDMSTHERWDLIEEYFLGKEDYVEDALGIQDNVT